MIHLAIMNQSKKFFDIFMPNTSLNYEYKSQKCLLIKRFRSWLEYYRIINHTMKYRHAPIKFLQNSLIPNINGKNSIIYGFSKLLQSFKLQRDIFNPVSNIIVSFPFNSFSSQSSLNLTQNNAQNSQEDNEIDDSSEKNIRFELEKLNNMDCRSLRKLAENYCDLQNDDVIIWSAICSHSIKKKSEFKYFDAIILLECFCQMNIFDKELFTLFSDIFIRQMSLLDTRHIISLIKIYETNSLRLRLLYSEIFHNLIRLTKNMYGHEYAEVLCTIASYKLAYSKLLKHYCSEIIKNINLFDFAQISQITAAAKSLAVSDDFFYYFLNKKQVIESQILTVQEVFDTLKSVKLLDYSWAPYEVLIENEFLKRINNMKGESDINELSDPFECLHYMKLNGFLTKQYLIACCKWCASAVYRPVLRSYNRPLAHQLVELHELLKEYDIDEDPDLNKAIRKFVSSGGGLDRSYNNHHKPLEYQKGRRYVFNFDPLEADKSKSQESDTLPSFRSNIDFKTEDNTIRKKFTPIDQLKSDTVKKDKSWTEIWEMSVGLKKSSSRLNRNPTFKLRIRPKRQKNQPVDGFRKPE